MTATTESLLQHLAERPDMTQRERARCEALLWAATLPSERVALGSKMGIGCLAAKLGTTSFQVECRAVLHAADVVELWDEVDRGMPLSTAVRILRKAKHRVTGRALREAVLEVLGEYGGDGTYVARTAGGGYVRRRAARNKVPLAQGQAQSRLWTTVRNALMAYLDGELRSVEADEARVARAEAAAEIDAALLGVTRAVARAMAHEAKGPRRRKLVEACQQLGVAPPPVGKPADVAKAKKAMKRLVMEYHPDARGGDESARPALEAALAAYGVIEDYNRTLGTDKPFGAKQNGAST